MAHGLLSRSLGHAATHVPGLRRLPVFQLISLAEVGLLARDHALRLTPAERHRLIGLLRTAHGRPSRLGAVDREELAALVTKLEARFLAGEAVNRFSPIPLPKRVTHGKRADRRIAAQRREAHTR